MIYALYAIILYDWCGGWLDAGAWCWCWVLGGGVLSWGVAGGGAGLLGVWVVLRQWVSLIRLAGASSFLYDCC